MPPEFALEVPPAGEVFWEAFHALSTARTVGGGMTPAPNPIAYSEASLFARDNGMDIDETWEIVQQLDAVWRLNAMKRLKPKRKTKGPGTPPRRHPTAGPAQTDAE